MTMEIFANKKTPKEAAKDAIQKVIKTEAKAQALQEKQAALLEKRREELEEKEIVSTATRKALRDVEDEKEEIAILLASQRQKLETAWLEVRDELADKIAAPVPGLREKVYANSEKLKKLRCELADFERLARIEYSSLNEEARTLSLEAEELRKAPLPDIHEFEALLNNN